MCRLSVRLEATQLRWSRRNSRLKYGIRSSPRHVRTAGPHLPSFRKMHPDYLISNVLVRCHSFSVFTSRAKATLVLLILDRNIDLVSMVSHGWTYQALVSDCLEIKLNRVVVAQPQKRSYDLDAKDFFWARNAANPFPQVAGEIDAELNKYKQDAAEITRSTGVSDVNDISQLQVPISYQVLRLTTCL